MADYHIDAYETHIKTTETPGETDAAVLEKVALSLEFAKKTPQSDEYITALKTNQIVWTIIQTELTAENPMPLEIKANLTSLAIFVDKQTFKALASDDPKLLDTLININRNIAAGLRQGAENAVAAENENKDELVPQERLKDIET